jgi:hypothetical protein
LYHNVYNIFKAHQHPLLTKDDNKNYIEAGVMYYVISHAGVRWHYEKVWFIDAAF